jgi:hypothetical protein
MAPGLYGALPRGSRLRRRTRVFEHRTATSRPALRLCVLGAGLLIASPAAHAQLAVIDNSNLAENLITAAQMLQAVAQLKAQLAELETTYTMLTNPQNILSMATGLENSAIENPMPIATALPGLLGGTTTPSGAASTYYSQNHIYTATAGTPAATQLNANAQAIANIQGIASNNLSAIQARLQELPNLEANLNAAGTITNIAAVRGRIEAEANFVQAQQAQATNLQVLASEQQASQLQQQQEQFNEDAADYVTEMKSVASANGDQ